VHDHEILSYKDRHGEWQERDRHEVIPMTRAQAHDWVMKGDVELLSDVFGEPPEAAAEPAAPEATIYVRVPLSLKTLIEAKARGDSLSVNSYVIRCLESCAGRPPVEQRNKLLDAAGPGPFPGLPPNRLMGG
jgi:hypothetical protein